MPTICRSLGIQIRVNSREHPPPHIPVVYAEWEATVDIRTLAVSHGSLAAHVRGLVMEWAAMHQEALAENWYRIQRGDDVLPIWPLE